MWTFMNNFHEMNGVSFRERIYVFQKLGYALTRKLISIKKNINF